MSINTHTTATTSLDDFILQRKPGRIVGPVGVEYQQQIIVGYKHAPVDGLVAGPFVENHRVIVQVLSEIECQCIVISFGVKLMDEQSNDGMPTVDMPTTDLNAEDRSFRFG